MIFRNRGVQLRSWSDTLKVYREPATLRMLLLGFSAGLPLMLVLGTLSFWLREAGIDRSTIGYLSWVGLAYAFKWMWAPLVDRMPIPFLTRWLGRRRSWLLISQGAIIAGLIGIYLVVSASIRLLRNRTALLSNRSAARLVICGPFRYTRNPIYLGYTLLTLSAGVFLNNGWILMAAIVAAAITHLYVIRKEEMHLLARFGYEFERYCRRTRVWI